MYLCMYVCTVCIYAFINFPFFFLRVCLYVYMYVYIGPLTQYYYASSTQYHAPYMATLTKIAVLLLHTCIYTYLHT